MRRSTTSTTWGLPLPPLPFGHSHAALECALGAPARRPVAIVARTVKGFGVPALEGEFMSHYRSFRPHERHILFAGLDGLAEAA